jgi:hypothetical protein
MRHRWSDPLTHQHVISSSHSLRCVAIVLGITIAVSIITERRGVARDRPTRPADFTQVAPILQRSCQACHRPGGIGPMSLMTYEDARPWAKSIKQQVVARDMPPWFIDRRVGVRKFKDDPSLTDEEVALISAWVDGGAPRGHPDDLSSPDSLPDPAAWQIGTPDLVLSIPSDVVVAAAGPDGWQDFVIDTGLPEDRYLQAVETRPAASARAAVHHVLAYVLAVDEEGEERSELLDAYIMGRRADVLPPDAGRLIKAGSRIRLNVHYHSIGRETVDRPSIALKFHPPGVVPRHLQQTWRVGEPATDLDIPAGDAHARHDGYFKLDKPTRLTSFQPHMHERGKALCMEAILPDMRVQPVSCVNRFKFGWQLAYTYAEDAAPLLPAGTILHVIGWHDNSAANRANPDPRNWAGLGGRIIDEMSFAWVTGYELTEEEFAREVGQRSR